MTNITIDLRTGKKKSVSNHHTTSQCATLRAETRSDQLDSNSTKSAWILRALGSILSDIAPCSGTISPQTFARARNSPSRVIGPNRVPRQVPSWDQRPTDREHRNTPFSNDDSNLRGFIISTSLLQSAPIPQETSFSYSRHSLLIRHIHTSSLLVRNIYIKVIHHSRFRSPTILHRHLAERRTETNLIESNPPITQYTSSDPITSLSRNLTHPLEISSINTIGVTKKSAGSWTSASIQSTQVQRTYLGEWYTQLPFRLSHLLFTPNTYQTLCLYIKAPKYQRWLSILGPFSSKVSWPREMSGRSGTEQKAAALTTWNSEWQNKKQPLIQHEDS